MPHLHRRVGAIVIFALLAGATTALTDDQKREFLRTAEIIAAEQTSATTSLPTSFPCWLGSAAWFR